MARCKHGIIEGQCHTCKAGPVGFRGGKDRNVYGDIDYLEMPETRGQRSEVREEDIYIEDVGAGLASAREAKKNPTENTAQWRRKSS